VRSSGADLGYPGERLGLPQSGSGSVGGYGRRLGALFIDWLIALLTLAFLARLLDWHLSSGNLWPLAIYGVETWLLVGLLGLTIGKRLCRLRVVRLDGRPVGPLWDRDYRGLHDRAAGTLVIRA
jgi:uncharacterized RDD family membrane protein YckC